MSVICNRHHHGFFSCCSVKLTDIVEYINLNSKIPEYVDSSELFSAYKKNEQDITYDFFTHYDNITDITINHPINYHWVQQFIDYSKLDYYNIIPVVKKYFSPSVHIINYVNFLKEKYNIDYNNCIAVYYRRTDKILETNIASFDEFYSKIKEISDLNKDKKIIIQTDCNNFLDYIKTKNHNIIIIEENERTYSNNGIHIINSCETNYNQMFYLFSTFLIISKCNHIICSSGNCSEWIMFYRENSNNVHQYLNGVWF